MKRYTGLVLILILLSGCTKEIPFEVFEMSYDSGWADSFSFRLYDDGHFKCYNNLQETPRNQTGVLRPELFERLQRNIITLKEAKIKSRTEDCVDCGIISVMMTAGKDTARIYQKGAIDRHFRPLITQFILIMQQQNEVYEKPVDYSTAKDIAPLLPKTIR